MKFELSQHLVKYRVHSHELGFYVSSSSLDLRST